MCTYNNEMKKKYYKANDSITAAHAHLSSSILHTQKKQTKCFPRKWQLKQSTKERINKAYTYPGYVIPSFVSLSLKIIQVYDHGLFQNATQDDCTDYYIESRSLILIMQLLNNPCPITYFYLESTLFSS